MGRKHYLKRGSTEQVDGLKLKGMTVEVRTKRNGESDIDSAIKILKKKMNREGIPRELRKREYYESKGQVRRRKRAEAIRRHKKMLKEQPSW